MNALIHIKQQYHAPEEQRKGEIASAGEIIVIFMVCFMVVSIFIIGIWSAVLLITGNTGNGGPIGLLFHFIHTI